MKICRRGHQRDDSEIKCKVCHKERKAAHYQLNREAVLAKLRQDRRDLMTYRELIANKKPAAKK